MKRGKIWLMDIKDKMEISKTRCCPPHYFPHKLPFGKKICNEKCHFHAAKWRMIHHTLFCKYLKCPNYKFMMKKKKSMK
jgi:hypothetical protein